MVQNTILSVLKSNVCFLFASSCLNLDYFRQKEAETLCEGFLQMHDLWFYKFVAREGATVNKYGWWPWLAENKKADWLSSEILGPQTSERKSEIYFDYLWKKMHYVLSLQKRSSLSGFCSSKNGSVMPKKPIKATKRSNFTVIYRVNMQ